MSERTQVAIVGAGPAGLLLGHLLHRAGIESVVLENRSRDHVEQRVRAGVLEQSTVDVMAQAGVGDRLARQGLVHEGVSLQYDGRRHRIDFVALTGGRTITIYGQQEVVKDLIDARHALGAPLHFEVADVAIDGFDGGEPVVRYTDADGVGHELRCDIVAGCDGFHGICRPAVEDRMRIYEKVYPFAWLGILAQVAPSYDELIYCRHERGFALASLRSPEVTRLYLQVEPDEDIEDWSDDRIWDELSTRLAVEGWTLRTGPIVEKGITPMRSFVAEPMRFGRLFLAGDAVHIVPPTGAKGLNLAVADVCVLASALEDWFGSGDARGLDAYSETCLARVWRVQHFSWWMTSMLHRPPGQDPFDAQLQRSQLRYVTRSAAGATTLAENYVGLPLGHA